MSTAIEASLDDAIAVTKDSLSSTTPTTTATTASNTRVIKQLQPLIQVYFPITHIRFVDARLPVARTATACGIHYSSIFLASSSLSSLDMPKISRATQARLLRKSNASIPASTSTTTTSSLSSSQQQQQSIPTKDTPSNNNDTLSPSPKPMTLERESSNEACCSSNLSDSRDIVSKDEDQEDGSDATCHLATAETATTTTPASAAVDETKDSIHASTTLEPATPTPHLSTPPSRSSSSSSRIPIRKSNSLPTAKSPEAITTTRRAPTTASTSLHKRKHEGPQQQQQQQTTPRPRPASPKPSTVPIRNKTAASVNRPSSPSPKSIVSTKVREADVPMPKKPIPTSPPIRIHGAHKKGHKDHTKQGNDGDEEDEAPVRITAQERRRRENMRAQQIKMWRVREEREARDARTIARRKMMERPTPRNKEPSPPPTPPRRAVKFNLKRNKVIEIPQ
ncbi:predicted protein [Lichtheimia corymbifera JMRC:FSU:9682]|uniref:Uncharacterized protein n=1 Tax=Lichtheimia corymbifera JMRC:FSU:9682 TaxID=1263082 RepID=A0A068SFY3_9FUNG|nr:predicted protein [Lichtheimia corymbifera JMRC:FSU:9682]